MTMTAFEGRPRRASLIVVCFGGVNLMLIQWVLVRELTALLLGTELIVLVVSIAYFAGLSLGYVLGERIKRAWLVPLGVLTLALHLSLPFWLRLLTVALDLLNLEALALIGLPLLVVLTVPAFYSIFLPLFAADGERTALPLLYAAELLGAVLGVLLLVLFGGIGLIGMFAAYAAGFCCILLALGIRPGTFAIVALLSVVWLLNLNPLNLWSNTLWYQYGQGLPEGTQTLFTAYSPYQKVDVLESPNGRRYLFLDGLEHFGDLDGSWLNVVMGQIPARLTQPERALVIGAGSMEMERMIADVSAASGGQVTTVEIDPVVVETSLRYFDPFNAMSTLTNRDVVIDDAKHFIANTNYVYDLVATDTPAAFSVQTATLYSVPFFQAVEQRLSPDGVFVINLTSTFELDDEISRRIAASALQVFDEVMVVNSGSAGWSFAYAADDLPFDRAAVEAALREAGEMEYVIFEPAAVALIVRDAPPITFDALDIVLLTSGERLLDRLR
jgi:spermidine synthase